MGASLKIILHTKKYADGCRPVMLQCIVTAEDGNVCKRRQLCRVKPEQFDKPSGRIIKHPNAIVLNVGIAEEFNKAEKRLHEFQNAGEFVNPDAVINGVTTSVESAKMLIGHGRAYVAKCKQKGQIHTAEKYASHVNKLAEYLGNDAAGNQKDVLLDRVTEQWLLDWSVWLRAHGSKSANTIHRRMAFVNTLYRDARKRGLTKADPMAFLGFKEQKSRKVKLSLEQLQAIETVELTGALDDARNAFLMQFFAYGSRISDALQWKKADITKRNGEIYLEHATMKDDDIISVKLNARAVKIVEQYFETVPGPYLLPFLAKYQPRPELSDLENLENLINQVESKTAVININLKKVAVLAKLDINLTTHISRHTFATLADERVTDKRVISKALGHSKFATTEIYLGQLRQGDVNTAMDAVYK